MEIAKPRRRWVRAAVCCGGGVALVLLSTSRWDAADPGATASGGPHSRIATAAADLPAGLVLTDGDLQTADVPAGAAPPSAVTDVSSLAGRRLVVSLRRGDPIFQGSTVAPAENTTGRRLVRLHLSVDEAPTGVGPGMAVEVTAALDAQSSPSGHPGEHVVAVATVVAVEPADLGTGNGGAPAPAMPAASAGAGAGTSVILDCGSADALRVLWARDFARSMRLVLHPPGDRVAPDSGGPGA